jgi:hypothetical protein
MAVYYYRDTSGPDTNLQIYALRRAKEEWWELDYEIAQVGESGVCDLKERCVFVLAILGLSISQLLGQNNPSPSESVPFPIDLFKAFVNAHNLDSSLIAQFESFNRAYNGVRHFGTTTSGKGHAEADSLTFQAAKRHYEFGLRVWKEVIAVFCKDASNELDDLDIDDIEDH